MEPIGPQTATSNRHLKPLPRNRRQTVRQRVHSPAYASLNGSADDMVLDLSEILDISEHGASIHMRANVEVCGAASPAPNEAMRLSPRPATPPC